MAIYLAVAGDVQQIIHHCLWPIKRRNFLSLPLKRQVKLTLLSVTRDRYLKRDGKEKPTSKITRYFPALLFENVLKAIYLLQRYHQVRVRWHGEICGTGEAR